MIADKKCRLCREEGLIVSIGKKLVRVVDGIVEVLVLGVLLLLLFYGCFAIWDSRQIYREADASRYQMYKPDADDNLSFEELRTLNPEVFGWISVYGTGIDYPLVQSKSNEKYINTNAKGEYSLSGSIFLDYRNNPDFTDFNSIIYGHHMEQSAMFGDLNNFKDMDYFGSRRHGNLYYDGKDHGIEFFAFLEADAYDRSIYIPAVSGEENCRNYLENLLSKAMYCGDITAAGTDRIVMLSTCVSDITNGRHILVGKVTDVTFPDVWKENREASESRSVRTWLQSVSGCGFAGLVVLLVLLAAAVRRASRKYKQKGKVKKGDGNV